jgi:hypothetical protein
MTGLWIGILFLVWYALALAVSERYNKSCRLNKQWLFFISFIFSPLMGLFVVYLLRK